MLLKIINKIELLQKPIILIGYDLHYIDKLILKQYSKFNIDIYDCKDIGIKTLSKLKKNNYLEKKLILLHNIDQFCYGMNKDVKLQYLSSFFSYCINQTNILLILTSSFYSYIPKIIILDSISSFNGVFDLKNHFSGDILYQEIGIVIDRLFNNILGNIECNILEFGNQIMILYNKFIKRFIYKDSIVIYNKFIDYIINIMLEFYNNLMRDMLINKSYQYDKLNIIKQIIYRVNILSYNDMTLNNIITLLIISLHGKINTNEI